jgi:hypothetical protein
MIAGILTIAATARRPAAGSSRADHSETGRRYRLADRLCHRRAPSLDIHPHHPTPSRRIVSVNATRTVTSNLHLTAQAQRRPCRPAIMVMMMMWMSVWQPSWRTVRP